MMNMLIHNGLAEIEKYKYLTPESHVRTQVIIYIIWYIKLFHPLKTTTNSHSFQNYIKEWNSLPQNMVELQSLASFKAWLAKHF